MEGELAAEKTKTNVCPSPPSLSLRTQSPELNKIAAVNVSSIGICGPEIPLKPTQNHKDHIIHHQIL